jgi:hypothetical protein
MNRRTTIGLFWGTVLLVCYSAGFGRGADSESARPRVRLRIVDAVTGAAVPSATVSIRPSGQTNFTMLGLATRGLFKFVPPNDDKMVELYVEAKDFKTRHELKPLGDGIEIRLDPEPKVSGVLIAPDGFEAAHAMVTLMNPERMVLLTRADKNDLRRKPGDLKAAKVIWESEGFDGESDEAGRFEISSQPGAESFFAVHSLGCASVSMAAWTNGARIRLRPWTVLRGRLFINGKPAGNQTLFAGACTFFDSNTRVFLQDLEVNTDADGRFVFDHLPQGEIEVAFKVEIGERRWAYSHWTSFVADTDLPAQEVVYDLKGRDVSGRLKFAGAELNMKPADGIAMLSSFRKANWSEFRPLKGGAMFWANDFLALTVDNNGVFSGMAIPPGDYVLDMKFHDWQSQVFRNTVTIPAGNGPIDVGMITITNAPRELR